MTQARNLRTRAEVERLMSPDGGAAIIDFWSPTCGPCRMMSADYDALAEHLAEEPIEICKIDTAAHPELAKPFHIRAVPTLLFVLHGEIVDVNIGALMGPALAKRAQRLVRKAKGEPEPGLLQRLFGKEAA